MSVPHRRDVLKGALVGAGGLALLPAVLVGEEPVTRAGSGLRSSSPPRSAINDARTHVQEEPRKTPVAADVDVLVVGGGPTGIGAALAAASQGAKVLVVERHGMLGGMWTAGLLNPLFEPGNGWIVAQLLTRLKDRKAWVNNDAFVTETMKFELEQMLAAAKAEFWLYVQATDAIVVDSRVQGIIVEGKSGREAILAKVTIDCTGDGDIAARAGVPFQFGRETDRIAQPMTLMCEVRGDNLEGSRTMPLKALQDGVKKLNLPALPYGKNPFGTPYLINCGDGVAAMQATHVYRYDGVNTRDLSRATVEARKQVHEIFMPALRASEKWKNIQLSQTAPMIGVRETRHLEGLYRLDGDDVSNGRRFEDAVAACRFPCDIHELFPDDQEVPKHRGQVKPFEIPYRCLLPKALKGLLFAGRSISGTHVAHASYRVTGTCMAMGQAAGLAAAMAVAGKVMPHEVDGKALSRALRERGVRFLG